MRLDCSRVVVNRQHHLVTGALQAKAEPAGAREEIDGYRALLSTLKRPGPPWLASRRVGMALQVQGRRADSRDAA